MTGEHEKFGDNNSRKVIETKRLNEPLDKSDDTFNESNENASAYDKTKKRADKQKSKNRDRDRKMKNNREIHNFPTDD
mgnify:FL=1|jgi:hypothetical protein